MENTQPTSDKTHYDTGAVRDNREGKPQYLSYFSPYMIVAYGLHMWKNAKKYGEGNWIKGIPKKDYLQSAFRHLLKLWAHEFFGIIEEPDTDHAAAIIFNINGYIHERDKEVPHPPPGNGVPCHEECHVCKNDALLGGLQRIEAQDVCL